MSSATFACNQNVRQEWVYRSLEYVSRVPLYCPSWMPSFRRQCYLWVWGRKEKDGAWVRLWTWCSCRAAMACTELWDCLNSVKLSFCFGSRSEKGEYSGNDSSLVLLGFGFVFLAVTFWRWGRESLLKKKKAAEDDTQKFLLASSFP